MFEFASAIGALRAKVTFPADDRAMVRCTTSVLPSRDVAVPFWPRDVYVLDAPSGTVHTAQRGLRSGIVFAGASDPAPCTLFYFQNFSSLTDYFEATKRSPSDTVGGRWPELGYAPPAGEECVLPQSLILATAFQDAPSKELRSGRDRAAWLGWRIPCTPSGVARHPRDLRQQREATDWCRPVRPRARRLRRHPTRARCACSPFQIELGPIDRHTLSGPQSGILGPRGTQNARRQRHGIVEFRLRTPRFNLNRFANFRQPVATGSSTYSGKRVQ